MNRTLTTCLGVLAIWWMGCDSAVHNGLPVDGGAPDRMTGGDAGPSGSGGAVGGGGSGGGGLQPGQDAAADTGGVVPDAGGVVPDAGNTTPDAGPRGPLSWPGVYDSNGVWDLSGPITAQRTLGDVVGDLLIEEIVGRAGVPSALAGTAQDAVRALIGGKVKSLVDAAAPAPLKPGSDLMKKLATVLASTEVASTIDIYAGASASSVRGSEEIRSFTFGGDGAKKTLPVGTLLERTVPLITLGAEWKGKQIAPDALGIDQHPFELRFGKMVLWIVDNVLQEAGAASLSETAASLVDCGAIVSTVLGGKTEFSFGVGIASFSVGAPSLQAGCSAVVGVVRTKALGLFDVDAGVQVGGDVTVMDADADAVADLLMSRVGFGGIITKVRASLAPRVAARFTARRRMGPRAPAGLGPHYADVSNAIGTTARLPVRGRLFRVAGGFDPTTTTPFNQISQEELAAEPVTVRTASASGAPLVPLGTITTDGEGYLDHAIDIAALGLTAGNHLLQFVVRGQVAGVASARLLAPDAPAVVVRSDVDLTYLDTDFMSTTGKLALLVQRGGERATLPAMEIVYRALRRGVSSVEDLPLSYLSGSPNIFKMVLEEKMRVDQIAQDGVVLKPFKDIIAAKVTDVDLTGVVPALEEQVGYKLTALLRLRLDAPAQAQEILMGDDSEADAVAYTLYHRFTSRQLTTEGLLAALDAIPIDATWRQTAADLAPRVAAVLPAAAPVIAIYINRTGKPNARFPVAGWTVPALTRYHTGAWPLALDLYEEGRLSAAAVAAVKARLLDLGRPAASLAAAAQEAVAAGFVRAETAAAFP